MILDSLKLFFSPRYEICFKVICDKKTKRILREDWYIRYKNFPILPWKTIPSPKFDNYEDAYNWAIENLNVSPKYNHYGKEEFC